MLFGFDYADEKLVKLFTEELKQNPQISISALQRKYSLGFNRAVHNLELIDGLRILWKKSDNGTVVAVLPFYLFLMLLRHYNGMNLIKKLVSS